MHAWILPEYIADLLPQETLQLEQLRRRILDRLNTHGYQQIMPPLLEYTESLQLNGDTAHDLQMFRLIDQLSGRQLGLRADMTPQAARIDAHLLNKRGVTRLCYAGPVAHALPRDLLATREPFQIGAELYGCADVCADIEIMRLLLEVLAGVNLTGVHLDLSHVGILHSLLQAAQVDDEHAAALIDALQQKDGTALAELTATLPEAIGASICRLPHLYGGLEVLAQAAQELAPLPGVQAALSDLQTVATQLQQHAKIRFDLAEQPVGAYHNGLVFAAYVGDWPNAISRGGRYDHVGQRFGRARPAVGFSLDARELQRLLPASVAVAGILAPNRDDPALAEAVATLRAHGETVLVDLLGQMDDYRDDCDRQLVLTGGGWQVQPWPQG